MSISLCWTAEHCNGMVGDMLSLLLFMSVAVSAPKSTPAMRLAIDNGGVLTKETITIGLLGTHAQPPRCWIGQEP